MENYLFNLITYLPEKNSDYFYRLVEEITSYFPAHTLFVKESAEDPIFFLLQNILPDLPVVTICGEDLSEKNLHNVLQFSTRCIVDRAAMSRRIFSIDLVDLNWAKTRGWREAIKEVFDSPERFEQIASCKKIVIRSSPHSTQALYLQAWLACQIGCSREKIELIECKVEDIIGVEVEGEDHFSMQSVDGTPYAKVQISSLSACEIPFTVMIKGTRLRYQFIKDLMYSRSCDQYLQMLQLLER